MLRMTSKIAIALTPPELRTWFLSRNMRQPSAVTVTVPSAMTCRQQQLRQPPNTQMIVSNIQQAWALDGKQADVVHTLVNVQQSALR